MDITTKNLQGKASPGQGSGNPNEAKPAWRWLWFVGIWAASVLALTVVSQIIRWAIMP